METPQYIQYSSEQIDSMLDTSIRAFKANLQTQIEIPYIAPNPFDFTNWLNKDTDSLRPNLTTPPLITKFLNKHHFKVHKEFTLLQIQSHIQKFCSNLQIFWEFSPQDYAYKCIATYMEGELKVWINIYTEQTAQAKIKYLLELVHYTGDRFGFIDFVNAFMYYLIDMKLIYADEFILKQPRRSTNINNLNTNDFYSPCPTLIVDNIKDNNMMMRINYIDVKSNASVFFAQITSNKTKHNEEIHQLILNLCPTICEDMLTYTKCTYPTVNRCAITTLANLLEGSSCNQVYYKLMNNPNNTFEILRELIINSTHPIIWLQTARVISRLCVLGNVNTIIGIRTISDAIAKLQAYVGKCGKFDEYVGKIHSHIV